MTLALLPAARKKRAKKRTVVVGSKKRAKNTSYAELHFKCLRKSFKKFKCPDSGVVDVGGMEVPLDAGAAVEPRQAGKDLASDERY